MVLADQFRCDAARLARFARDPNVIRLIRSSFRICSIPRGLLARAWRAPKNLQDLLHPSRSFGARVARAKEPVEGQLSWDSDCLYACGFRIYCTPLPGFFSPFPHGTGSLSVDHEYLALEDGPPIFRQDRQDYTCPALLVVPLVPPPTFHVRGCHPLRLPFPEHSVKSKAKRYRLLPFRSPLLWESRLISVPAGTEMFQFSAFAPATL